MMAMNPPAPTPALLAAVHNGDPVARGALFDAWLPVVMRWCARLGGPGVDPEDATHDVFVCILARLPSLRDPAAFVPWVFGITRRTLHVHRRRAWWRRWVPGLGREDGPDPDADLERLHEEGELADSVNRLLDALDPTLREVLVLCELEERTDLEAASMLGVPTGTVKSRLRRARARFEAAARAEGLAEGFADDAPRALAAVEER